MTLPNAAEILQHLSKKSPFMALVLMRVAMGLVLSTWMLLINNFAVEKAAFNGSDWGAMQSLRELPGFLAFLVVFITLWINEQRLAILSLFLLAIAVMATGFVPNWWGIMITTLLSSIGFHYFEAVYQSLQLQWLDKEEAAQKLGWINGIGSFITFLIYAAVTFLWQPLGWNFLGVFLGAGLLACLLSVHLSVSFPQYETKDIQNKGIILRRRYWLFYLLQFLAGARRQIFIVFAGFMMVEKYGFKVHDMAGLLLATFLVASICGPLVGWMVKVIGERLTLQIEYVGLAVIFGAYMCVYIFDWPFWVAASLYVLDHVFFSMAIAIKTYFQKIADPKDIASTAAVSFTINHIAAVVLPVLLGFVWIISPHLVFGFALVLALCSFTASCLIPQKPRLGTETVFAKN